MDWNIRKAELNFIFSANCSVSILTNFSKKYMIKILPIFTLD